jgi:serine/threonine protein kinase
MKMNVRRFQDMAKEVKNLRQMNQSQSLAGTNNIIHLEEVIASERSYYLVFEYCNGGDLRDMLKA